MVARRGGRADGMDYLGHYLQAYRLDLHNLLKLHYAGYADQGDRPVSV